MLNKDMVFSGLRDFVIRIGEAVSSGQQVAIPFSLGVLHASERKVTFAFDPEVTNITRRTSKVHEVQEALDSTTVESETIVESVRDVEEAVEIEPTVRVVFELFEREAREYLFSDSLTHVFERCVRARSARISIF